MSQGLDLAAFILNESIRLCLEVGQTELVASGLMGLAVVAARDGHNPFYSSVTRTNFAPLDESDYKG